jgi:hypothetical protein
VIEVFAGSFEGFADWVVAVVLSCDCANAAQGLNPQTIVTIEAVMMRSKSQVVMRIFLLRARRFVAVLVSI